MRRTRRIIFNTLTTLSALLLAVIIALWAWSVLAPDTYHLILDSQGVSFGCTRGHLLYEGPPTRQQTWKIYMPQGPPTTYEGAGPTVFLIRCWRAALACAILPALWLGLWYKRRPPRTGLCPSCGYDLRATPNRCPECGCIPDDVRKPDAK